MLKTVKKTGMLLLAMALAMCMCVMPVSAASGSATDTVGSAAKSINKAAKVVVKDVEYDADDREVEFEFKGKVSWKSPKVKITDKKGNNYVKKIKSKDSNDIEVKVKKLKEGKKYNYKITGVKKKGTKKYTTVKGTFRAHDD